MFFARALITAAIGATAALGCLVVTDATDPQTVAEAAAAELLARTDAVVLGSGWAPAAAEIGTPTHVVAMADLPGFTPPTAEGHRGQALVLTVGDKQVLVLVGRIHAYEGHDLRHVVHPVRTACAAGAGTVVLTNAAGGLRNDFGIGQPVLISDHLNLTARSPLVGAQFVDLVDAYSPRLRALARDVDPTLAEGVYEVLVDETGPAYLGGLADIVAASGSVLPLLASAYRTGEGVPYAAYGPDGVSAQAALNRPAIGIFGPTSPWHWAPPPS